MFMMITFAMRDDKHDINNEDNDDENNHDRTGTDSNTDADAYIK